MSAALPVTVIGGYLGAGKTTLVNHLLRHAEGRRLAVLVNEFGELPIDADLIEAEGEDLISISGGCVCCSFGSDLTSALLRLAALAPRPDHVVIEASGVAIPGSILSSVSLLAGYRADGVVILADAAGLRRSLDDPYVGDTVRAQVAGADIIVLNKMDLVSEAARGGLVDWVAGEWPQAAVLPVSGGAAPVDLVLGVGGTRGGGSALGHADGLFESLVLEVSAEVDAAALAEAIATGGYGVVRAKGWVGGQLLHVVGQRWAVTPGRGVMGLVCIGVKGQLQRDGLAALVG